MKEERRRASPGRPLPPGIMPARPYWEAMEAGPPAPTDYGGGIAGKGARPEKNVYSHPGDGFGYLCRYFHRQADRNARNGGAGGTRFVPPRSFGGSTYHQR